MCRNVLSSPIRERYSRMPIYRTAPLDNYKRGFVDVARNLFERVCQKLPDSQTSPQPDGSFSIFPQESRETAAKIVIYQAQLKWTKDWPPMAEGVYIWIRANGPSGRAIWDDILPLEIPWMFDRMNREDTVQIALHPQANFAYFPVMAGDDMEEVADFIAHCA